jgi:hypothetical protein
MWQESSVRTPDVLFAQEGVYSWAWDNASSHAQMYMYISLRTKGPQQSSDSLINAYLEVANQYNRIVY